MSYAYDAAGNRSQVTTGVPTPDPLTVSVFPSSLRGTIGDPEGTQGAAVASALGGVEPYAFLWQRQTGSSFVAAEDATADMTIFNFTGKSTLTSTFVTTWRCQVTDSTNVVAYSPSIQVTFAPEA